MEIMVAIFLGLLVLLLGILLYRKFVKEPKWDEFPEDLISPDMSLDKKRKRRMRVSAKSPGTPRPTYTKPSRKID